MSAAPQLLFLIAIVVCAGATNMAFVKSAYFTILSRPMDAGIVLADGRRLFGDNKTWKGFFGMIVFTALWVAIAACLAAMFPAVRDLSLIPFEQLGLPLNVLLAGALLGLAYVLAEVPNSYCKRRIDIPPGQNAQGMRGLMFLVLDQADSVIGCVIVLPLFSNITRVDAIVLVVLGSLAHYLTNLGLYAVRLKRQAG